MNDLIEQANPSWGGFRSLFLDWQKSEVRNKLAPEAAALSWTMLW